MRISIVMVALVLGGVARAQKGEVATSVVLRDMPDLHARVVERIGEGMKVTVLGASRDRRWLRVRARREGWAPRSFIHVEGPPPEPSGSLARPKGLQETADDRVAAAPAHLTPEAWGAGSLHPQAPEPATQPVAELAPAPTALAVTRAAPLPRLGNAVVAAAGAGVAVIARRFSSNGAGPLASYAFSTTAVAAGASLGWAHGLGRRAFVGIDGAYAYAGAARVRWRAADGSDVLVGLQTHDADAGLRLGVRVAAAGGLALWLRGGATLATTIVDPDARVRLSSDRLLAPTAGLGLDAPRLASPGGHDVGLHLAGRALFAGQRTQNLSDGSDAGTWGASFGGGLSLSLWASEGRGQVLLAAAYEYGFTVSRYSGASQRDAAATRASLGTARHLATAALAYSF